MKIISHSFLNGIKSYKEAFIFLLKNKAYIFSFISHFIQLFLSSLSFFIFLEIGTDYLHDQALSLINSIFGANVLKGGIISKVISISLWIFSKIFFLFLFLTFSGYLTIIILSPIFFFFIRKNSSY